MYEMQEGVYSRTRQPNPIQAAIAADKFSSICKECHGEVILETNPKDEKPKYDKDHQYPNNSNC